MVNNTNYNNQTRRLGWIYSCGFIEQSNQTSWKVIGEVGHGHRWEGTMSSGRISRDISKIDNAVLTDSKILGGWLVGGSEF